MAKGKGKEISTKSATFAKGGTNKMFGKQTAGPQVPGGSAHKTKGGDSKFASGGKGKMFGFTGSKPAKPR